MTADGRNVLLIGGSGFVSGTLARACLRAGHETWAVTRGTRPAPEGVIHLQADRHDEEAFEQAIEQADQRWDLVVDCIAYVPADVRQDVAVLGPRADHLFNGLQHMIEVESVFDQGAAPGLDAGYLQHVVDQA